MPRGQREQRRARVRCQQELHTITWVIVGVLADLHGDCSVGHGQSPKFPLDRRGELRTDLTTATPDGLGGRTLRGQGLLALLVEFGHALVELLELAEPTGDLDVERHHRRQVVAVLPPQVLEDLAPLPDRCQPLRCLVDRLTVGANAGHDVVEFGEDVSQPHGVLCERRAGVDGAERRGERIASPVVVGEGRHCERRSLAVRGGVGEHGLLVVEPGVLVGIADVGGVEFVDLEPQEVDLARPSTLVATEGCELRIDLGQSGTGGSQRGEIDTAELVERRTLCRRGQQRLMRMLTVEIDDVGCHLGERRNRGEPTIEVRPRSAGRGDDPGEDAFVSVSGDETPVDSGLVGSVADARAVGTPTDEQLDRLDQHRLAGAGLAGHGRQPDPERQLDTIDHTQILDVQFGQHATITVSAQRSARPNLAFRIWW